MYKMNKTYHNKIFVAKKGKFVAIKYTQKSTQFGGNQLSNCIFVGRHDNIRHTTIENPTKKYDLGEECHTQGKRCIMLALSNLVSL